MQIYFTDTRLLAPPLTIGGETYSQPTSALENTTTADLVDGIPFILDDDGSYDIVLNRFFRECPSMRVRSRNSLKSYARDILTWMRFLSECRKKAIWQANAQDVISYHRARRQGPAPTRISAASWNRSIAALEKLYRWAEQEELITTTPFAYRHVLQGIQGTSRVVAAVRTNQSRESAARRHDIRFLSLDHFLLFRDVGLRGWRPDKSEDALWCGRNGMRNALFADLLVTTGLRLEEASSLLLCELPIPDDLGPGDQRSISFRLPAAVAKGNKSRDIRLPIRILRRLLDYRELERMNAVARFKARQAWKRIDPLIPVLDGDARSILIKTHQEMRRVRLDLLMPAERRRLVILKDGMLQEPAALWLTEAGLPVPPDSWEAVFRRASQRCRTFGINLDVTPHTLRHTFAVHMLSHLVRAQIGAVFGAHDASATHGPSYRRMMGDPLQRLQRLLGHSSITSTYIYLDSMQECQELVDAAADRLMAGIDNHANPDAFP